MSEYQEQAEKFLADSGAKLTIECDGHDYYFDDDDKCRDIGLAAYLRENMARDGLYAA